MRRIAATFLAVLALWLTATPLLACVIPTWSMTLQERDCCEHMQEMCGAVHMPASHTCCKTQVRSGDPLFIPRDHTEPGLQLFAFLFVPAAPQVSGQFDERIQHHPPSEFLPDTTVLRI